MLILLIVACGGANDDTGTQTPDWDGTLPEDGGVTDWRAVWGHDRYLLADGSECDDVNGCYDCLNMVTTEYRRWLREDYGGDVGVVWFSATIAYLDIIDVENVGNPGDAFPDWEVTLSDGTILTTMERCEPAEAGY